MPTDETAQCADGTDRAIAEKERGLLEQDYATPCPKCGGVVFEWWGSDTCRDCEDSNDDASTEQTTLMTDGGEKVGQSTDDMARKARGATAEKKAHRMDWEEYILYSLEVNRDEINEGGLSDMVALLNRHAATEGSR